MVELLVAVGAALFVRLLFERSEKLGLLIVKGLCRLLPVAVRNELQEQLEADIENVEGDAWRLLTAFGLVSFIFPKAVRHSLERYRRRGKNPENSLDSTEPLSNIKLEPTPSMRTLIWMDDHQVEVAPYLSALAKEGVQITTVDSPAALIEAIEHSGPFDAVVMDLLVPASSDLRCISPSLEVGTDSRSIAPLIPIVAEKAGGARLTVCSSFIGMLYDGNPANDAILGAKEPIGILEKCGLPHPEDIENMDLLVSQFFESKVSADR